MKLDALLRQTGVSSAEPVSVLAARLKYVHTHKDPPSSSRRVCGFLK